MAEKKAAKKRKPPVSKRERKLTAKQAAFVDAYVSREHYGNGTAAARAAGYKGNAATLHAQATDNLSIPHVAAAIAEKMREINAAINVTVEGTLRSIVRIADKAEACEQFAVSMRGWEIIGKHLEMFTKVVKHTHSLQEVSDEDLYAMIQETARKDPALLETFARIAEGHEAKGGDDPPASGTPTTH